MLTKGRLTFLFLVFLIFIGFGDSFLPQPLSGYSFHTRTSINNFVIGMVPGWKPKTQPYKSTEKAIEETEKGNK
jgi:hypothetical protein